MTSPGSVAFTVFGIDVMWYGILVASAFCLAIMLCYFRAPKHQIQPDHVLDFAIWMIPVAIIVILVMLLIVFVPSVASWLPNLVM